MKSTWTASISTLALLATGCATNASVSAPLTPAAPVAAATTAAPPGTPLAKVGDEIITVEEFRYAMGARGGRNAGQFASVEQRRALLNALQ